MLSLQPGGKEPQLSQTASNLKKEIKPGCTFFLLDQSSTFLTTHFSFTVKHECLYSFYMGLANRITLDGYGHQQTIEYLSDKDTP